MCRRARLRLAPLNAKEWRMVGVARFELATPAMSMQCSTAELYAHSARALAAQLIPFKPELRTQLNRPGCGLFVEQPFYFKHQVFQMKRLRQYLCLRHRFARA